MNSNKLAGAFLAVFGILFLIGYIAKKNAKGIFGSIVGIIIGLALLVS